MSSKEKSILNIRSNWPTHIFRYREATLSLIIIVFSLLLSIRYPNFLTLGNLKATLVGLTSDAIIAVGMCMLLITGEIDLSVGSTLALAGAVTGLTLVSNWPIILSISAGILVGVTIGLINAFVVDKLRVNFFIATLGMMQIARGIAVILAEGGIAFLPPNFTWLGQKVVFGFQLPVWFMFIIMVVFGVLLAKHRVFRQLYYIGGNRRAAALSGINISRMRILVYTLTGALAAFAGVLNTARFGSAISTAGANAEMRVIAAAVIGGCSMAGGEGTILGVFLGTIFMSLISSALVTANVSVYWHSIVTGLVLISAVAFDILVNRNRILLRK
ncbi:MAG: ABC transporter permease [Firmicutes bacterium]|nr:ABC transporter permease [Bacillota bacterium]